MTNQVVITRTNFTNIYKQETRKEFTIFNEFVKSMVQMDINDILTEYENFNDMVHDNEQQLEQLENGIYSLNCGESNYIVEIN